MAQTRNSAQNGKAGANTRNAMADHLFKLLRSGVPLSKIKVRDITDACGCDRQTFYYHFHNINELADYAYKRAIASLFDTDDPEEVFALDWRERVGGVLKRLKDEDGELRGEVLASLGDKPLRAVLYDLMEEEVRRSILPNFQDLDVPDADRNRSIKLLTYALEAILMAWIDDSIEEDEDGILDTIERTLMDYSVGLRIRLANENNL